MFNKILTGLIGLTLSLSVAAADGMISKQSKHSVQMTADNLQQQLTSNGMKVFLRINHAENAKKVDIQLNPTELIIFGNPKAGSPLMKCAATVAIDLPQKANDIAVVLAGVSAPAISSVSAALVTVLPDVGM